MLMVWKNLQLYFIKLLLHSWRSLKSELANKYVHVHIIECEVRLNVEAQIMKHFSEGGIYF